MMKNASKENDLNNLQSNSSNSMVDSIFNAVFNNNQAIMILVDPSNHHIIDANAAAETFYGYTRDKLLTMDMMQINILSSEERHMKMEDAINKPHGYTQFVHKISSGILKNVEVYTSQILYNKKNAIFIIVHDITEQKEAELALNEREERFELAMAGSDLGIWDWWVQTGELHVNERWAGIIGYALEEISPLLINTWRELSHPEDIKVVDTQFQKYLNNEIDIYKCEVRMKHKDGSWVWIQTQGKVFEWTEDGKPQRMSGTHLDINEKKITEIRLAESEKKFRSYFDNSPLALLEEDYTEVLSFLHSLPVSVKDGIPAYLDEHPEVVRECAKKINFLDINLAAQRLYGAGSKDKIFRNLGNIFTEESYDTFKGELICFYNNGSVFSSETVQKKLDGQLIHIKLEVAMLSGARVLVTVMDITDQKTIEKQLIESENKFRSYFESSPLSLWEEDHSDVKKYLHNLPVSGEEDLSTYLKIHPEEVEKCIGLVKILNMNQATLDLYEAKNKDQMINDFSKIFTSGTIEAFKDELISLYKNEPSMAYQFSDVTLTGREIDVKLEMTQLLDNKYLTIITDITESKNRELELRELLSQTKADAETKEILLREINHRVKNNLSSFIGMLYAEKKQSGRELKEAQMEHVDSLINRVKGISIAHDLLSRSQWAPISLYSLSEKIVNSLNHLIPAGKSIKTEIIHSSVFLDADQSHSMAVVINELFINCIEHASHEGEEIKVKFEIKKKNGKITYIYCDNGPGFSEKILNSESFNVGLYLIKNIVEQSLRGSVQMENKDGARVIIQFPGGVEFEEL